MADSLIIKTVPINKHNHVPESTHIWNMFAFMSYICLLWWLGVVVVWIVGFLGRAFRLVIVFAGVDLYSFTYKCELCKNKSYTLTCITYRQNYLKWERKTLHIHKVYKTVNGSRNSLIGIHISCHGLFPLPDSDSDSDLDTDSLTMQILWERDSNLNLSQWKHVLHNTM